MVKLSCWIDVLRFCYRVLLNHVERKCAGNDIKSKHESFMKLRKWCKQSANIILTSSEIEKFCKRKPIRFNWKIGLRIKIYISGMYIYMYIYMCV